MDVTIEGLPVWAQVVLTAVGSGLIMGLVTTLALWKLRAAKAEQIVVATAHDVIADLRAEIERLQDRCDGLQKRCEECYRDRVKIHEQLSTMQIELNRLTRKLTKAGIDPMEQT